MEAAQQLRENNSDLPSVNVHIDNHVKSCDTSNNETTLLTGNQPTSSPSHTVYEVEETGTKDLTSDLRSEGNLQSHTIECIQRPDNDCICRSVASNTDGKSSFNNLVNIVHLVDQTDVEEQRGLLTNEGHHWTNSHRNQSFDLETGRENRVHFDNFSVEKGTESHPYNTHLSESIIPNSRDATTLDDTFDLVTSNVQRQMSSDILNKNAQQPQNEGIKQELMVGNKSFSYVTTLNIINMPRKSVYTDTVSFDTRPFRVDYSAYYNLLGGQSSEENDADGSKVNDDIGEEDQEDVTVVRIHKPNEKSSNNVNKVYEALKGNIHPSDEIKELKMTIAKRERKIQKKAKRPFVPVYIKDIHLPRQGNFNLNGQTSTNTCTVDLLTVIFLQLKLQPGLKAFFIESQAPVFKTVLLELFTMFEEQQFEDVRIAWAKLLPDRYKKLNFYGMDRDVIYRPFSKTGCFIMENGKEVWTFRSCISIYVNSDNGLNLSDIECMVIFALQEDVNTRETDLQLLEPPPMIILDIWEACVEIKDVGDLSGTINFGPYSYRVGGFSSLYKQHYTARILLEEGHFTYDNQSEGREVKDLLGELSLIFLFRKKKNNS